MTLLGLKLWLSLQEGNELISQGVKCLPQVQWVVSSSRAYIEEGQMALHPQKVECQRLVGPQLWNPAQVKLWALDYELMDTRRGLLLSWPWLKWRGLCTLGCAEWFFFRRMTSKLPTLEFGGFRNLKGLCDNENGKNQRFKQEFKCWLAFSQVGSQVAPFRKLIRRL